MGGGVLVGGRRCGEGGEGGGGVGGGGGAGEVACWAVGVEG